MSSRYRLGAATLLVLAMSCAGQGRLQRRAMSWRWPPAEPRVELVEVIENQTSAGSFWRRVAGVTASAIFSRPYGVAWDGDDLIVADPGAGRVLRLDPRGRTTGTSPDLVEGPIGVAVCAAGIVVSDSRHGELLLLDRELNLVRRLADGLRRPTGVSCSGHEAFVAETGGHRLLELDLSAPVPALRELGGRGEAEGEFNYPAALALDGSSLWVGDTLNFRVQHLATSGEFLASFGDLGDAPGEMPRIKGLAVDDRGQLWVSDGQTDRVALYRADGTFLTSFGTTGSGEGQFSFPAGIAAHSDGRVAVVDSLNRRVVIFRTRGPGESGDVR